MGCPRGFLALAAAFVAFAIVASFRSDTLSTFTEHRVENVLSFTVDNDYSRVSPIARSVRKELRLELEPTTVFSQPVPMGEFCR